MGDNISQEMALSVNSTDSTSQVTYKYKNNKKIKEELGRKVRAEVTYEWSRYDMSTGRDGTNIFIGKQAV